MPPPPVHGGVAPTVHTAFARSVSLFTEMTDASLLTRMPPPPIQ